MSRRPCDVLVYTEAEWEQVLRRGDRFAVVLAEEVTWVFPAAPPGARKSC